VGDADGLAVPDPRAALALDDGLFEDVEEGRAGEALRFWESRQVAVIVGRSGVVRAEVNEAGCSRDRVPVIRRTSGGSAVIVGPGCLSCSLVLSLDERPELRNVPLSYEIILTRIAAGLGLAGVTVRGPGDLTLNDRKVSGSAQRRGRRALLHHGTFLCNFDLRLMERYLRMPPRSPAYRRGRSHGDFVANLPLSAAAVRARLISCLGSLPTAL
jgi:lipoate---protein ligase